MPKTQNRAVMTWILVFMSFAVFLVVFGGFVRLTRSGLSIVEWNPVGGAIPPLNQQAWQTEFAKYQLTPEYQKVNYNMTLDQYREIFIIEWFHRIFARIAGFIFAIPFFVFIFNKSIPLREAGFYVVMGILFLAQAVLGWIMVSSGLVDQPSVSHYLLTSHLFLALTLIGLSLWTALGHYYGFPNPLKAGKPSPATKMTIASLFILLIQIAYGGFTSGLKAGYISNTWPLMLGQLIPQGLLIQVQPMLLNLIDAPLTVVFIHRWFAFVVLAAAAAIYWLIHKQNFPPGVMKGIDLVAVLVILQITLGILVLRTQVQIAIALLHQANAIALFASMVYLLHRLHAADQSNVLTAGN
jgi:cytochrome c oxidase assembly protein subunit 15